MIRITNFYDDPELNRYYEFITSRRPKDQDISVIGDKIVKLINRLPRKHSNGEKISDFEELLTMDFSKLKKFYNSLDIHSAKYKKIIKRKTNVELLNIYKEYYTKYFYNIDSKIKMRNNMSLIKNLGITVCPYCNRNYINSRKTRSGTTFDHFYDKNKYQYFALTLGNLVPCCGTCNLIKSTKSYEFCPFDEKSEEVTFRISPPGTDSKIELYFGSNSQTNNILELEEAYNIHQMDVNSMFQKEEEYCIEYRKRLIDLLSLNNSLDLNISEKFFDTMIYGDIASDSFDNFMNCSLSKLKKDTYNYIVRLRKN